MVVQSQKRLEKKRRTLYDNVRCCLSLIGMVFCNNCSGVKIMGKDFIKGLILATSFFIYVVLLIIIMGIQFPHGGI